MTLTSIRTYSSTREQLMQILRKKPLSVRDLADLLNLTTNAVRSHLTSLEREGFVRTAGQRKGIRKPETLYELTPNAEMRFPKVYHVVLNILLDVIKDKLPEEIRREILNEVGTRVSDANEPPEKGGQTERLQHMLQVLDTMGGYAELDDTPDGKLLQGYSCPLGEVTNRHPEVCSIAKKLLEKLTDMDATILCSRNGKAKCVFKLNDEQS